MTSQEKNQHSEESLFPVFRFDLENRLTFANLPALPLMQAWNCRVNEKLPAEIISRYPELFHASLSHRPTDLTVEWNNYVIRFTIVPFPEARYIGMYAYAMELNGKYTSGTTTPAGPVSQSVKVTS
jgi:hypothetical protein